MLRVSSVHALCRLAMLSLPLVTTTGCRHRVTPATVSASSLQEDHCWWAVMRSPLRPDSVTARFARAFTGAGMAGVQETQAGDTSWVWTAPTPIPGNPALRYASRVVAYRRGDSTHFRHFISTAARSDSSVNRIGLCATLARTAAVNAFAPREPTGEETLPLWTRVP